MNYIEIKIFFGEDKQLLILEMIKLRLLISYVTKSKRDQFIFN